MSYFHLNNCISDDAVMFPGKMLGIIECILTKIEKQSLWKYMTIYGKDSADAFDDLYINVKNSCSQ